MSSSSSFTLAFLLSTMFMFILFTNTSHHVKGDLIDDICSKTDQAYHCSWILRTDPNIKQDNITDLSNAIMSRIQDSSGIARFEMYSSIHQQKNFNQRTRLDFCFDTYYNVIDKIMGCANDGDYQHCKVKILYAQTIIKNCDNMFIEPPFDEPSFLKQTSQDVLHLLNILWEICNYVLAGQKM
ncbi:hypothetical protein R3W88_030723 [Solanum pinnatisectum]|uniref:Pectinesterase inhibitor domain-containing protein n=1 Tax=Solanum pinnatisectum TaxID=50273 RepID=A0AAV9LJC5_9SOLN|nr:hypothetical protein R3W88_030723 [Solanum pinnatisectum]